MPEPCPFLSRKLPACSIIRPTQTNGIAINVVNLRTSPGLFIGQSPAFFKLFRDLAEDADAARRDKYPDSLYGRPLRFGEIKAVATADLAAARMRCLNFRWLLAGCELVPHDLIIPAHVVIPSLMALRSGGIDKEDDHRTSPADAQECGRPFPSQRLDADAAKSTARRR
jgi:hypothetical protein